MSPSLLVLDHRYRGLPDAKTCSDFRLWLCGKKYLAGLFFREFSAAVCASLRVRSPRSPSAFGHHVGDVVAVCAETKMRRVHADTVIAAVKDVKPIRDGAICQLPSQSVGGVLNAINAQASVPMIADGAGKDVASAWIAASVVVKTLLWGPVPRAGRATFHGNNNSAFQHSVEVERHSR